jgi:hypothetical protein
MTTLEWATDSLLSGKGKDTTTSQLATVKLAKSMSFKMSTMAILKVSGLTCIIPTASWQKELLLSSSMAIQRHRGFNSMWFTQVQITSDLSSVEEM